MVKEARELADRSAESEAFSVSHALEKLTDPRRAQGKRDSLALILTCVLLAKLAGETTLQAISEWVRLRSTWLQHVWPETRAPFPCAATSSKVFRRIDPEQGNQLLMDVVTRVRADKRAKGEQQQVVWDGKTLRGTQGPLAEDQQKRPPMKLYEAKTGIVLAQRMVAEKAGEWTHLQELLTPTLLKGRIISGDALSTPRAFGQRVVSAEGDDLLFVKGNHPPLQGDWHLVFREPPLDGLDWRVDEMADKGQGRRSPRLIQVSTERNDFLAREWPGIEPVFCLRRRLHAALQCPQE